jgi:hypothetical protein
MIMVIVIIFLQAILKTVKKSLKSRIMFILYRSNCSILVNSEYLPSFLQFQIVKTCTVQCSFGETELDILEADWILSWPKLLQKNSKVVYYIWIVGLI